MSVCMYTYIYIQGGVYAYIYTHALHFIKINFYNSWKKMNQLIKIDLDVHGNTTSVFGRISWHRKEYAKINNETDISLCVSFFHYNHMPSVALVKDKTLSPWRAEEWRSDYKKEWGRQVRLSSETKGFGYLGHLCSQKSGIAEIRDRENTAEPVVEELR